MTDRSIINRSIINIMPRTPEQFKEIREERKLLITNTALELFAAKGFHGTSISMIAEAAGISKGLIYNYFSSKEELVIELMKSGFMDLMSSFDPNYDKVLSSKELKYFIINVMNNTAGKCHFWRLYFSVISQPIVNNVAFGEIMEIAMPFFKILTEYFEAKGINNPEVEARFFAAMIDGVTLNYVFDPETFPLHESINRILEIYNLNETKN